jgi:hypothetical protein
LKDVPVDLALALTFIAVILTCATITAIPVIMIRKGMGIRYVHDDPPLVIPGEVIKDDDTAFFDEHDLAAMEAHEERPEFVHTEILVNGIKAGPDGVVPPAEESSWWRR